MFSKSFLDNLEYQVTAACIDVHKSLGPGLLESVYRRCLMRELSLRDINFKSEQPITIFYRGLALETQLRADLIIENCLVLELKSIEKLLPIHEAQLLTYMKLIKAPCGMLINFNSTNIVKYGKRAFVSEYYRNLLM
jgi:GxxExxY protein